MVKLPGRVWVSCVKDNLIKITVGLSEEKWKKEEKKRNTRKPRALDIY